VTDGRVTQQRLATIADVSTATIRATRDHLRAELLDGGD